MLTKPKVNFTKERFYPDFLMLYGMPLLQRHINRYKWATSKLKSEDLVLDAGCGCGYFDHILLNACRKVHGMDISGEAIAYARWKAETTKQDRLVYTIGDLQNVSSANLSRYDAVVCIEAIEHMEENGQHNFMSALKNIIPDGKLLITTPKKGKATGDFHKHEFTEAEFKVFLEKYFDIVSFDKSSDFKIPDDFMIAVCEKVKV